jgi:flagellar hook-associated protein 1 FlgK
LTTSLVQLSSDPANTVAANAAIGRARELVDGLNAAGEAVSALRRDVDSQIASTVEAVGELLRDFEQLNTEIVRGFRTGRDTTDALDRRDQILGLLSREISIRAVPRADNDIALFTESGVTLFETTARNISFAATPTLAPGVLGGAVVIDGVPLLGMAPPPASFGATTNGRLGHLLATRDRVLPTVEAQLDEIARGLVVSFREVDQSAAPSLPDAPGLFTWPGAPAVPVAGVRVTGLASTIALNSAFDPASGGSAGRLRDGGANGAAYVANSSGAIGFSGWLNKLIDRVQEPQVFSTSAGLATSATIGAFAASSAGWVAEVRQRSIETAEQATVTAQRASDALRATTGINLDAEMLQLIEVERSFQASSKLINAIDEMFESLLSAVR